jgi:hypothetical protein
MRPARFHAFACSAARVSYRKGSDQGGRVPSPESPSPNLPFLIAASFPNQMLGLGFPFVR